MRRALLLGLGAGCIFAATAAILANFMPKPLKESDYLVIGSVATLMSLLTLFLALMSTTMKSPDVFFKRRRK